MSRCFNCLLILLVTLNACNNSGPASDSSETSDAVGQGGEVLPDRELLGTMNSRIDALLNCSENDGECLSHANAGISQLLEGKITEETFAEIVKGSRSSKYSVAISPDKVLCVVSYDTRMGGSSIDYKAYAIFKTDTGIRTTMLDFRRGPYSIKAIHEVTNSKNETIYLLLGSGTASSYERYQAVIGVTIADDIIPVQIFAPNESMIRAGYQSEEELALIGFQDNAIMIPIISNDSMRASRKLQFDGNVFRPAINTEYKQIGLADFETVLEAGLINGSDLPLEVNSRDEGKLFVFSDISVETGNGGIVISNSDGTASMRIDGAMSLRGKKGDYLFIEGEDGTPEEWPLLIFDLKKREFVYGTDVSKCALRGNDLLYLGIDELNGAPQQSKCGADEKFYELRVLHIDGDGPIVELTKQGFCIYIQ